MKKTLSGILGFMLLTAGLCTALTGKGAARVNVEVNIGPPVIMIDEPPEVVYAPALGVYFVPDAEFEIFFYSGLWWSRRGNFWYSSRYYGRGWTIARNTDVPRPLFRVPRDYRARYAREPRIRYRDWKGRPGQPKNVNRGAGNNMGRPGNWGKAQPAQRINAQPSEKNISPNQGQEKGQPEENNSERGGERKGGQEGNQGVGGHWGK